MDEATLRVRWAKTVHEPRDDLDVGATYGGARTVISTPFEAKTVATAATEAKTVATSPPEGKTVAMNSAPPRPSSKERTSIEGVAPSSYRLGGVLGRGGMGVVHRATQAGLERSVAVKTLAGDPPPRTASASPRRRASRPSWSIRTSRSTSSSRSRRARPRDEARGRRAVEPSPPSQETPRTRSARPSSRRTTRPATSRS